MEGIDAAQLAALQKKLSELGVSFVDTLPPAIRRRVRALRGLQAQRDELYEKFLEERAALEAKYAKLYDPLLTRRKEVVTGKAEPTDEEVEAGPESGSAAAAAAAAAEGVVVENNEDGDEKGIPDFWLQAMRHHEAIGPAITDNDAEVLEYVEDIKTGKLTGEEEEGFWLEFHFRDNPFFDNTVLRKEYVMIDEEEQLLDEARGTEIDWKKGKDVTTKLLKKKSKKGGPKGKVQTKREKVDSFFHFFNPPEMPEDESDLDEEEAEELQDHMETDYEMGLALRNKIVPCAIDWFTGDAVEDDSDSDDENDDEHGDDEDGDEDYEDSDEDGGDDSSKSVGVTFGAPAGAKPDAQGGAEQPPECKQQ